MGYLTHIEFDVFKTWIIQLFPNTSKFFAIFSDDDPVVPITNKKLFEQKLGAKTIIEHSKGHFSEDTGIKELPIVLSTILSF